MCGEPPEWLRDVLSTARFAPYLAKTSGDVTAAIQLYWWNVEVSAAFYVPLHCLELGLRNAMHDRLCELFDCVDWWSVAPLGDNGKSIVSAALEKVKKRVGPQYVADDVVAELSFGFWVSLISRKADRTLWVPALHRVFPFYKGKREELHDNLVAMLLLRNRVMHHEPIHHRDLHADHAKIYRLLWYISPRMVKELEVFDRVDEVLRRRGGESQPGF